MEKDSRHNCKWSGQNTNHDPFIQLETSQVSYPPVILLSSKASEQIVYSEAQSPIQIWSLAARPWNPSTFPPGLGAGPRTEAPRGSSSCLLARDTEFSVFEHAPGAGAKSRPGGPFEKDEPGGAPARGLGAPLRVNAALPWGSIAGPRAKSP
jgi:hypothetical protein